MQNNAAKFAVGWVFITALAFAAPASAQQFFLENNVDRRGSDYHVFSPNVSNANECAKACSIDSNCQAWTYERPGVRGDKAFCHLKTQVSHASSNPCCVSGVSRKLEAVRPVTVGKDTVAVAPKPAPVASSAPAPVMQPKAGENAMPGQPKPAMSSDASQDKAPAAPAQWKSKSSSSAPIKVSPFARLAAVFSGEAASVTTVAMSPATAPPLSITPNW